MTVDLCLHFLSIGDPLSAQAALDECSPAERGEQDAHYLQAQIFMLCQDYGAALPLLKRLHRSLGDIPHLLANLGLCYLRLGRRHEAIDVLEMAFSLDGTVFEIRYNLAVALKEVGRLGPAREQAREAEAVADTPRTEANAALLVIAIDILENDMAAAEAGLKARDLSIGSTYDEVVLNFMIARGNPLLAFEHIKGMPLERRQERIFACANLCVGLSRGWLVGNDFLKTHFAHLHDRPVFWASLITNLYNARDFQGVATLYNEIPAKLLSPKVRSVYLKSQMHMLPLASLRGPVRRALKESRDDDDLIGFVYSTAMKQGDLALQSKCADLLSRRPVTLVEPFVALAIEKDPIRLLRNSEAVFGALGAEVAAKRLPLVRSSGSGGALRIGLISADFRSKHAVGKLLSGLLSRFRSSKDHYVFINSSPASWYQEVFEFAMPDKDLSLLDLADQPLAICREAVLGLELDILIDLSGFTEHHLQPVLMRRVAPIQVNWLGFPGTLASGAHDFIIGDSFVLPTGCEKFYAETVVRLPCCYQPNDEHRITSVAPSDLRASLGLSSSVVCGVFNAGHKLESHNLFFWTKLLSKTRHLQLLVLSPGRPFEENFRSLLRSESADADRVVFTGSMAYEEHMMRFQACDFMLDTSPYGSHTTASEALWNGCPVFTVPGQTFASRVAGSLNHHAGLGDLANFDSYDSLLRAVQVLDSGDLTRLVQLSGRLGRFNTGLSIFDSAQFFEHFEAALHRMVGQ